MALTRWNPWTARLAPIRGSESILGQLHRDVNRLFDEFLSGTDVALSRPFERLMGPAVDVVENEKEIHVKMDLPGMTDKDIQVSVQKDVVTIKGEHKEEKEEKGANFVMQERQFGSFERSIPLPVEVDPAKCEATFKNGVLDVKLNKSVTAEKAKRIEVRSV